MSDAYHRGERAGRLDGTRDGEARGYNDGYEYGYNRGHDDGYSIGYQDGKEQNGYDKGFAAGFKIGKDTGAAKGFDNGRRDGKKKAFDEYLALVKPPISDFDPFNSDEEFVPNYGGGAQPFSSSSVKLFKSDKGFKYSLNSKFNYPINLYSYDDYNKGYWDGYYNGLHACYGEYEYSRGYNDGYTNYYKIAYEREYNDGKAYGYQVGYSEGYKVGLTDGSENGNIEFQNGYNKGYQDGYSAGYYEKYQPTLDEKYKQMSEFYTNNPSLFIEKSKLVDLSGNGYIEKDESFEIKLVLTNIGLKSTFIESTLEEKPDYNIYVTLNSNDKRIKLDSSVFVLNKLDGSSRTLVGNLWGKLIDDTINETNGWEVSLKLTLEYNGEVHDTDVIKVNIMKELPADVVPFETPKFGKTLSVLNFRSSPANLGDDNLIDKFSDGEKLILFGTSKDEEWLYVLDKKERFGWVSGAKNEANQYKYIELLP